MPSRVLSAWGTRHMNSYRTALLSAALWVIVIFPCHAQSRWTIIDLGVLPDRNVSTALGVNENGAVAGYCYTADSPVFDQRAFRWSRASGMQDLGTLPNGAFSSGNNINYGGQVVGQCDRFAASPHPCLWSSATGLQLLGALPGTGSSPGQAWDINDHGQVVGEFTFS